MDSVLLFFQLAFDIFDYASSSVFSTFSGSSSSHTNIYMTPPLTANSVAEGPNGTPIHQRHRGIGGKVLICWKKCGLTESVSNNYITHYFSFNFLSNFEFWKYFKIEKKSSTKGSEKILSKSSLFVYNCFLLLTWLFVWIYFFGATHGKLRISNVFYFFKFN